LIRTWWWSDNSLIKTRSGPDKFVLWKIITPQYPFCATQEDRRRVPSWSSPRAYLKIYFSDFRTLRFQLFDFAWGAFVSLQNLSQFSVNLAEKKTWLKRASRFVSEQFETFTGDLCGSHFAHLLWSTVNSQGWNFILNLWRRITRSGSTWFKANAFVYKAQSTDSLAWRTHLHQHPKKDAFRLLFRYLPQKQLEPVESFFFFLFLYGGLSKISRTLAWKQ